PPAGQWPGRIREGPAGREPPPAAGERGRGGGDASAVREEECGNIRRPPGSADRGYITPAWEDSPLRSMSVARRWSRLRRAMFSREISLGQAVSHSPKLVQPPKPSSSICSTMAR